MSLLNRRNFLKAAGIGLSSLVLPGCSSSITNSGSSGKKKPNFIVIFCDDMGYGDIGCFGSTKHRTPNIDQMATEGIRFTDFYVSSGVCTPSRASLMTGCYPRRVNMHCNYKDLCVLFPNDKKGLNPDEITIADMLRKHGYATGCFGKWHLGDQPEFLPTSQGFDCYFGIPYSNDMRKNPLLPLVRNKEVIEAPAKQETLTRRYADEVIKFIKKNKDKPFFVYLPNTFPHWPLHASGQFKGKSANGIYGDAVEEIDFNVGRILAALKEFDIDDNTLVIFTSDNGSTNSGSNLPLSGWKGSTDEGGMREPFVARWPGRIPAGKICSELATTMDILPTFAVLSGTKPPTDRIIDGKNIWPLLCAKPRAKSPHEAFYYYQVDQLQAVRSGKWKLHLPLEAKRKSWGKPYGKVPLQLFDLKADIGEKNNVADKHPDVVKRLLSLAGKAREDIGDIDRPGKGQRPAGYVDNPKPLLLRSK